MSDDLNDREELLTPEDFGAVPDGKTECAPAYRKYLGYLKNIRAKRDKKTFQSPGVEKRG